MTKAASQAHGQVAPTGCREAGGRHCSPKVPWDGVEPPPGPRPWYEGVKEPAGPGPVTWAPGGAGTEPVRRQSRPWDAGGYPQAPEPVSDCVPCLQA